MILHCTLNNSILSTVEISDLKFILSSPFTSSNEFLFHVKNIDLLSTLLKKYLYQSTRCKNFLECYFKTMVVIFKCCRNLTIILDFNQYQSNISVNGTQSQKFEWVLGTWVYNCDIHTSYWRVQYFLSSNCWYELELPLSFLQVYRHNKKTFVIVNTF